MDFPGGSVVKTLRPSTQGAGSVPVRGAEILSLTAKREKRKTNSRKTLQMAPTHTKIFKKKRISILQYGMGHPYTAIALLFFLKVLSFRIVFPSSFIEI